MGKGTAIKICHAQFEHVLTQTLNQFKLKNILIVCGKNSFSASGAKERLKGLESGFNVTLFKDFSENPTVEEAELGYKACIRINADAIIAVGGGSAIDIAKLIVGLSVSQVSIESLLQGNFPVTGDVPCLIAVPTTSGSGSESTHFAVVYKGNSKYSVANEVLFPRFALLDGSLTMSMSRKQAACSGLDAFCQAVESAWSKNATEESRNYAVSSLKILDEHLIRSVNVGNLSSRAKCIEAANLAGQAINITKTTAPHAFSYHLTKKYAVSHGLAVALSMIAILKSSSSDSAYYDKKLSDVYRVLSVDNKDALISYIEAMIRAFDLPLSIAAIGCSEDAAVDEYLSAVNVERLGNHPVNIDTSALREIILKGL